MRDRENSIELIRGLLGQRKFGQAVIAANSHREKWGSQPELLWMQSTAYFEIGDAKSAESALREYLSHDASNHHALVRLSRILREDNRSAEAISLLEPRAQHSEAAEFHAELAECHLENGNSDLAILYAQKSLDCDPSCEQSLLVMASSLILLGACQEAIRYLEHAQKLSPANPQVYINLAVAHETLGQTEQQVEAFESALACDASLLRIRALLANLHLSRGNYEKALQESLMNQTLGDHSISIRSIEAFCRSQMEQPEQAITLLLDLVKEDDEDFRLWILLAEIYVSLGDISKARAVIDHILINDPANDAAIALAETLPQDSHDNSCN